MIRYETDGLLHALHRQSYQPAGGLSIVMGGRHWILARISSGRKNRGPGGPQDSRPGSRRYPLRILFSAFCVGALAEDLVNRFAE